MPPENDNADWGRTVEIAGVLTLTLRPAWWVGERVSAWSPCGVGHPADRAACIPWSRAFDPVDVR